MGYYYYYKGRPHFTESVFRSPVKTSQQNQSPYWQNHTLDSEIQRVREIVPSCCGSAPDGPSDLIVSSGSAILTWQDNSDDEMGFKIQRSVDNGTTYSLLDTVGANTSSYTDEDVSGGNTYYYRIYAFNRFGTSSFSNTSSITFVIPPQVELLAYWTMNETGLNTRIDSVGDNHLSPHGSSISGDVGVVSGSLKISSNSSWMEKTGSTTNWFGGDIGFTICGWTYMPNTPSSNRGQPINMFVNGTSPSGAGSILQLQLLNGIFSTSDLTFTDTSGSSSIVSLNHPTLGAFHFYRVWFDTADSNLKFEFDRDGNVASASASWFTGSNYVSDHTWLAIFGRTSGPKFDETGFWQGVLTDSDADLVYNSGSGQTYPNLPYV